MEELMTLYAVSVSITFLVSLALLLAVKMVTALLTGLGSRASAATKPQT